MHYLHGGQASRAPRAPAGLVRTEVGFAGVEAPRSEWFLSGTQQTRFAVASIAPGTTSASAQARIITPTNGSIIALDPDMPPQHQRLRLAATSGRLQWLIDGQPFAKGTSAQWLPWPGRHLVQIADDQGKVLDQVTLEVRGAGLKKAGPGPLSPGREAPRP
jgi:penicillin-binding protein 1C